MRPDAVFRCADSVARASRTVFPPNLSATTGRTANQGFSTAKGGVRIPQSDYFFGLSAGLVSPGLP